MKKISILGLILLLFILIFTACTNETEGNNDGDNDAISLPKVEAVLTGKIVDIKEGSILLSGNDDSGLFTLVLEGNLFGIKGQTVEIDVFKVGQIITIGYSGVILEIYPSIPSGVEYIKIEEQQEDLIGLYLTAIDDLWKTDTGLNADIDIIALNLSQVGNLDSGEKEALRYMVGNIYQLQSLTAAYDELVEDGLIDDENLYFERGILIDIVVKDIKSDSFLFDITKWRSGLGAYYFIDCKAKKTNDSWTYEVGSEAIS
ncbi:hypothetical protein [Fusibacter bizertensis]